MDTFFVLASKFQLIPERGEVIVQQNTTGQKKAESTCTQWVQEPPAVLVIKKTY